MSKLGSPHLTVPPGIHELIAKTHRGMAHYAGTGPAGATCSTCVRFETGPKKLFEGLHPDLAEHAKAARQFLQVPRLHAELSLLRDAAMSGGRKSRDKGNRLERQMVALMQERGRGAERVPLSGSMGGRYRSDISVPVMGADWLVECKSRGHGFAMLYRWLDGSDALIVKADRQKPLLVIRLDKALDVLDVAEKRRLPP